MKEVPVIDISQDRHEVAEMINEACIKWGFLEVSGHGVPKNLIDRMFSVSYEFFDLNEEEKFQYNSAGCKGGRGYYSVGEKALARTKGDLNAPGDQKETFFSGAEPVDGDSYYFTREAEGFFAKNIWPTTPADMKQVWMMYREACQGVADTLLSIFATALGNPPDWFVSKADKPISTLVVHHYPEQKTPPVHGAIRAGAHTDFGTLTLLMTEDSPGGLQVMGLDNQWHDILPKPDTFIVNIGDLMERWTNDTWRSTLHRVVNPPTDAGSEARRMSVVYFHTPNYDTEVTCFDTILVKGITPKYQPITAGAHHKEKIARNNSVSKI